MHTRKIPGVQSVSCAHHSMATSKFSKRLGLENTKLSVSFHLYVFKYHLYKLANRDWRNSSVVQSIGGSCRGPGLVPDTISSNCSQRKSWFSPRGVSLCTEPHLRESPIPRRRWPTENELNSVSGDIVVVVVNLFCTILAGWLVTKPFSHLKEREMNFLAGLCFSVSLDAPGLHVVVICACVNCFHVLFCIPKSI